MTTLKQHPLSAAWPSMQADEYQALKDSIEAIGVQNPITLYDGMVIDGWHRYTASTEVGIHCPSKLLGDVDPVDFVKSQNDARRNVTASQRAAAITSIYAWRPASNGKSAINLGMNPVHPPAEKTNKELAALAGTTVRTIQQAKVVQANATPEVKQAVKEGKMSVKKAAETVKPKKATKPTKPPLTVVPAPVIPPEDQCTELDLARDQIADLQAMLAIANLGTVAEEDKDQAKNLIAELRAEIKTLRATLKAVTTSRDGLMNELAQVKRQCIAQQRELKNFKGNKAA